ncbi:hypothetical protein [Streptomyces sp. NPDC058625]|uniref:hypothetical protein n=1 Tax=Streptomyces sp. NPDC058625 TaxID=3346564 RepID=UPI003659C646
MDQAALDDRAKTLVHRSPQGNRIPRFDPTGPLSGAGRRDRTGEGAAVSADGSVGMYRTGGVVPRFQHLVGMRTGEKLGPVRVLRVNPRRRVLSLCLFLIDWAPSSFRKGESSSG